MELNKEKKMKLEQAVLPNPCLEEEEEEEEEEEDHCIHTSSGAHPASYPGGTRGLFPWGLSGWCVKPTI
jgi:DNA-directed RNA polymerase specialized sigma54-like protein